MSYDPDSPDLAVMLPLGPYAPRAARHHVAQVDKPSPDLRDAVVLLTSELVTRAVECASGAAIELRVWMTRDIVRVEMRGSAEVLAHPRDEASVYSSLVLDQVAHRWRLDAEDATACIWFEIDRHPDLDREYAGGIAGDGR
jgi:hypothetical protein